MDDKTIQLLLTAPLHKFQPDDWPDWYERVAPLLKRGDANVRAAAMERLSMAVFWAEHSLSPGKPGATDDAKRRRAAWLLGLVDEASRTHPDVGIFLLDQLRYKGDEPPFIEVILPWLHALQKQQPAGVPLEKVEGAIVLMGGLGRWGKSLLPPLLDHESDYVRACAAHMLGRAGCGDTGNGRCNADFIAGLTAKELARPGIAGPFWSAAGMTPGDFSELVGLDAVEWMLGIIERRKGAEPGCMPFNGIDFHIHELAADNPGAIRRLIAAGRVDLALMAATEIRDEAAGMGPLLEELGAHADPGVAVPAQIHLARYHGILHPRADRGRIRLLPNWRAGARVLVIRYREPGRLRSQAIFFPDGLAAFDDEQAWSIVDKALPPQVRGELARHYLDTGDARAAPYRLGRDEMRSYASGAHVTLTGALDVPGWRRIEISPGWLDALWGHWS